MSKLRLAGFGIRGVVGESLTPRVATDYACAFATYLEGKRVLLGRDTRYSSPMLHQAVVAGLLSAGCEIMDYGVCPTPVLQHAVRHHDAQGAVSISGGHNAMGWNAITLIDSDGAFLEATGGESVLDCFHSRDFLKQNWRGIGRVEPVTGFFQSYLKALAELVNVEAIRRASFKVLIDPVGGAGCAFLQPFADWFGFKLVPINAQPSGYLAREPEPRPRSALHMASIIPHTGGHVGFVLSSDMGRMSLVTEAGEPASEEYTLALIASHVLGKQSGTLVTNICTTRTVDDLAQQHGATVIKTRVGQAYVVAALVDEQGVLGGEGSGSVALPSFSPAFDGFVMMALILEAMAETGCALSEVLGHLPRYHIVKRFLTCSSREAYRAMDAFRGNRDVWDKGTLNLTDGMRADWPDGWMHVRVSQTQQMVRVISEARDPSVAEGRADDAMRMIQQAF
jgi:phosphomannomutase